jgi:hypothetical protein
MRIHAPSIYAAGGFFAFPVTGPFGCDARKDGSIDTIRALATFFDRHSDLYRDARPLSERPVVFDRQGLACIARHQPDRKRVLLHIANHSPGTKPGTLAIQREVVVRLPVLGDCTGVTLWSPDLPQPVPVMPRNEAGQMSVTIPVLDASMVVVLEYRQLDIAPLAADLIIPTAQVWGRPDENIFAIGSDGVPADGDTPNAFVHGKFHPKLRNNPEFRVDYPRAGAFTVRVDQIADLGARIEIHLDDRQVLAEDLPGKGRQSLPMAFTVAVPAGTHRLRIGNPGADWFRVAEYVLSGYGR